MNHPPYIRFGQAIQETPAPPAQEPLTLSNLGKALGQITPTLLVVGIATGAAFAIGSGLVSRYVFKEGRRR